MWITGITDVADVTLWLSELIAGSDTGTYTVEVSLDIRLPTVMAEMLGNLPKT